MAALVVKVDDSHSVETVCSVVDGVARFNPWQVLIIPILVHLCHSAHGTPFAGSRRSGNARDIVGVYGREGGRPSCFIRYQLAGSLKNVECVHGGDGVGSGFGLLEGTDNDLGFRVEHILVPCCPWFADQFSSLLPQGLVGLVAAEVLLAARWFHGDGNSLSANLRVWQQQTGKYLLTALPLLRPQCRFRPMHGNSLGFLQGSCMAFLRRGGHQPMQGA